MKDGENHIPAADAPLNVLNESNPKESEGKLKIFLGMSAGVGKTYAMLKAGRDLKSRAVDAVVGIVETHGLKETENLLEGLETIPTKTLVHKNTNFSEMDLDAILQRKPSVVLVDGLAHTNAPESRHAKRYLDVHEILKAGISVYTTINIQDVESRVDLVREIIGVPITETVPDSVFDRADELVLIDISPEELIKRLKEGKVYKGKKPGIAIDNIFRKGNLTALREITLRFAAERVDKELRDFKVLHGLDDPWRTGSLLMVSVYASPYAEELIRWTRRLADMTDSKWIGVVVDNGRALSQDEKHLLSKNLSLIHQLGGEVVSTQDTDTAKGMVRVARQNNVMQIILGRSERSFLRNLFMGGSIVSRILKQAPDMDIIVVSSGRRKKRTPIHFKKPRQWSTPWYEAGMVFTVVIVSWFLAALLAPYIGYISVGVLFLLAVNLSAVFLSRFSSFILALTLSLLHVYVFIPPKHSIRNFEDFMILSMFFIAAAVTSNLTSRLASKEKILANRQRRTLVLYDLSKDLAFARSVVDVSRAGLNQLQKIFEEDLTILLPCDVNGKVELQMLSGSTFFIDGREGAVANWVYQNGRPAGRFTDTLSTSVGSYYPLIGREGTVGVLGVKIEKEENLDPERMTLIETFGRQIATALEREFFHKQSLKDSKPAI